MRTQTYYHTKFERNANRKNDTVPLQVNCVGAVSQDIPFENKSIRHDFYYIYVLKGKMLMEECTLLPGDVIILEPERHYHYKSEGKTEYLWVHYTGFEAYALTKKTVLRTNFKHQIGIHKEIIDCFKRLFREFIINDEAANQLSVCILREILLLTTRFMDIGKENKMPLLAIEYIHRFFKEDIDITSLARMENKSCTSFRNVFKEHTGVSPNEYIITQRISEACRLLSQTNYSVRDIAAQVGYDDQYYFSRVFKKKTGITPLRYRRENLS